MMNMESQVQQSDDIANFASRITQKYRHCMVVDLVEGSCYSCGVRSVEDNAMDDPSPAESYDDWLRIFVETEIELPEQSRMRWLLSPENLRQSLNDHHFFISVSYRNRRLPGDECWQRLQAVLLQSDNVGIPQRVMIVQEKINGSLLSRERRFFNCSLYGVMQFAVNTDGLNRWRRFSYLNVNDEALRIFGYTHDEFYEGMRNQQIDLIAPYDIPTFIDLVSGLSEVGTRSEVHLHIINRSGYVVTIGGEAELCVSDDGRRYIQIIFMDESRDENSRTALADMKKELKDLTDAIPCAVHRSLMAGKSTTEYVSREFTLLTGYDCTDLKINFDGVFQSILAGPDDVKAFNSGFSRALTTGKRIPVDFSIRRSDGSTVAVRDWLFVTHDRQDRLWLYGSMIENTEEKIVQSRAESLDEMVQYYARGLALTGKIAGLITSGSWRKKAGDRSEDRKCCFAAATDLVAKETGSSVIHYAMSRDGSEAECVYAKLTEDCAEPPVNLPKENIKKCLEMMKTSGGAIIPSPLVLKSLVGPELASCSIFKNAGTILMIPLEIGDDLPIQFMILRDPEPWILHHEIPGTVADNLRALMSVF